MHLGVGQHNSARRQHKDEIAVASCDGIGRCLPEEFGLHPAYFGIIRRTKV
jgi:hypothetical protein